MKSLLPLIAALLLVAQRSHAIEIRFENATYESIDAVVDWTSDQLLKWTDVPATFTGDNAGAWFGKAEKLADRQLYTYFEIYHHEFGGGNYMIIKMEWNGTYPYVTTVATIEDASPVWAVNYGTIELTEQTDTLARFHITIASAVPDAGSSLGLLAAGVVGLGLFRYPGHRKHGPGLFYGTTE